MNLNIQMVDTDTGEVLYRTDTKYSCNFCKHDTGRAFLYNLVDSCVRGVRVANHASIELKVRFCEPKVNDFVEPIPFND